MRRKPVRFGKYLLLERLSIGGMAEVFLGKTSGFDRLLAIKRVLPELAEDIEFIQMFTDEARVSSLLNHAEIVQVFDFGQHDDTFYLATEYVAGRDLRAVLNRCGRRGIVFPVPLALHIAAKVCSGLAYAHRRKDLDGTDLNIVHRDISPPNIIFSWEGAVKIIDFGVAKSAARSGGTRAGMLKGKVPYMSPEQAQGLEVDERTDLYALGAVLYQMLTGQQLIQGDSDFELLRNARDAKFKRPTEHNRAITRDVEEVVMKVLSRDREKRYADAVHLRSALVAANPLAADDDAPARLSEFLRGIFDTEYVADQQRLAELDAIDATPTPAPKPARRKPATQPGREAIAPAPAAAARAAATPPPPPAPPPSGLPGLFDGDGESGLPGLTLRYVDDSEGQSGGLPGEAAAQAHTLEAPPPVDDAPESDEEESTGEFKVPVPWDPEEQEPLSGIASTTTEPFQALPAAPPPSVDEDEPAQRPSPQRRSAAKPEPSASPSSGPRKRRVLSKPSAPAPAPEPPRTTRPPHNPFAAFDPLDEERTPAEGTLTPDPNELNPAPGSPPSDTGDVTTMWQIPDDVLLPGESAKPALPPQASSYDVEDDASEEHTTLNTALVPPSAEGGVTAPLPALVRPGPADAPTPPRPYKRVVVAGTPAPPPPPAPSPPPDRRTVIVEPSLASPPPPSPPEPPLAPTRTVAPRVAASPIAPPPPPPPPSPPPSPTRVMAPRVAAPPIAPPPPPPPSPPPSPTRMVPPRVAAPPIAPPLPSPPPSPTWMVAQRAAFLASSPPEPPPSPPEPPPSPTRTAAPRAAAPLIPPPLPIRAPAQPAAAPPPAAPWPDDESTVRTAPRKGGLLFSPREVEPTLQGPWADEDPPVVPPHGAPANPPPVASPVPEADALSVDLPLDDFTPDQPIAPVAAPAAPAPAPAAVQGGKVSAELGAAPATTAPYWSPHRGPGDDDEVTGKGAKPGESAHPAPPAVIAQLAEGEEHRAYSRVPVQLNIFRREGLKFVQDSTIDLSMAGVGIGSRTLLMPGTEREFTLASADGSIEIPFVGEVVHVRSVKSEVPYVTGVRIVHMEPAVVPRYEALLVEQVSASSGREVRVRINRSAFWKEPGPNPAATGSVIDFGFSGATVEIGREPQKGVKGLLTLSSPVDSRLVSVPAEIEWVKTVVDGWQFGARFASDTEGQALIGELIREVVLAPRKTAASKAAHKPAQHVRVGDFDCQTPIYTGAHCVMFSGVAVTGPFAGQKVALKRLRPEAALPKSSAAFMNEAELLKGFDHPVAAKTLAALRFGEECWQVMELVDGRSLDDVIAVYARTRRLPPVAPVLSVLAEVARALSHRRSSARALKVPRPHFCVRPSGVMIARDGHTKVVDFGRLDALDAETPEHAAKSFAYLPPELWPDVESEASEVFAVATLIYEALTAVCPFRGSTLEGLRAAVQRGAAPIRKINPEVAAPLAELIASALSYDPKKRPQKLLRFLTDLDSAVPVPRGEEGLKARAALVDVKGVVRV